MILKSAAMKSRVCLICAVIAVILISGCTGLQGPTGSISVSSLPGGAEVYLDGALHGRTPMLLENVPKGVHHVLLRGDGNSSYETNVPVTSGAVAFVTWIGVQEMVTPVVPENTPVFSLKNMKGYRGGGDYITSLSYDLSLAPGAKPVNMSGVTITFTSGDETINPYWEIADKKQANTDNMLESDETFSITMRTPRLGPGDPFIITFVSGTGQIFKVTRITPGNIGLDVLF